MGVLSKLARRENRIVHGFDSFEGLPEEWIKDKKNNITVPVGAFKPDSLPHTPGVKYQIGLFENTISKWIQEYPGMIAFLHIDSDLYSSCVTVLELFNRQIVPGTIITFDEIFRGLWYPEWREGEYKAFNEWKEKYDRKAFELNRTEFGEASFRILK